MDFDLSKINPPSADTPVYKDDCMFSFDTAFDDEGLDICMTCYQAFSRSKFDYTSQHSMLYDHHLFLNYRKVVKQRDIQKQHQHQPLKMLKLEVKEETEDDLFETKASVYDASIDATFPLSTKGLPEKLVITAKAIIRATSSEKKQEIKAWQQEIQPCRHSQKIEQIERSKHASLHQCDDCELDENLWICLECGNIGCGRSQFGGVPGNSHAVAHRKDHPDHHVAVKLGSLSTESADCYCYTCDDEVKVPLLAVYLKTYGIDLSHFIKTEKNLTELQIEQNVKWDFSMDSVSGESLIPVFGSGLTGFKNLGNSCYLASILQVIYSIPSFMNAYFSPDEGMPMEKIVGNTDPASDLETQMYKLGDGLLSGRYSVPDSFTTEKIKYQRGIRPSGFKSLIGKGHPEFSTMLQQDAFEFWLYLVSELDKQHIIGSGSEVPTEVFKCVLENKLKCTHCGGISLTKEVCDSVSVPVEEHLISTDDDGTRKYAFTTMEKCFNGWHQAETIDYQCKQCQGQKQGALKSQGFKTYPEYLVVNPQRIKLENWVPMKLMVPIKFNESLDLNSFKSEGKKDDEVELPKGEEDDTTFQFNANALEALISMGFPENRCKRALYTTGNRDAETASNWLFEHMDDSGIDEPFKVAANQPDSCKVSLKDVETLTSMGFGAKLAKKALIVNEGNVQQSVEWLFANPDDDGNIPKQPVKYDPAHKVKELEHMISNSSKYQLLGVVCHKGTSIHSGHYVAFVKKQVEGEERWVLFNDEKVVLAGEESLKEIEVSGYLYVYKRK
ncbi:hypothetical protein FOA43_000831 [Brettanomyces nanus]|uniref:Ubiquitin carboxyl-terminal hydrolase n=1 Tax=Eeniella nana TaxID=13502 RepID=A0A875RNE0_EENNA|nr:uncharacterized protein FOA43_000831 [Brettanomyces nanus]QPG73520.1 hypothetical protein FOA43_000831 [Brettanomyces nanus]